MKDIIGVICDGTMRAAAGMTHKFGKLEALSESDPDRHADLMCAKLREVLEAEMQNVLIQLKKMAEAQVGEAWLRAWVAVECQRLALKASEAVLTELSGEEK